MNPVRIAARSMLATIFIAGGVDAIRKPGPRAENAKPVIDKLRGTVPAVPADDVAVVRVNGALHLVFGTTLLLGKFQRLSALALAGTLVPTTLGGHRFWEADDPAMKANQQVHFQKNLGLIGGLIFAALDRHGKPSLTYRAGRAAKSANKRANRAASRTAKKASNVLPDAIS